MSHTIAAEEAAPRTGRARKAKALLAAGVVLGVGAAVTLASWNDSEFAQGFFSAGTFNLVGSTDGAAYTDHATAGSPAALAFTVDASALSPGAVTAAPFAVRLDETTTSDATVTLAAQGTTGTVTGLSYEVIRTSTFGCDASTTGTTVVPAGTAVGSAPAGASFALAHGQGVPGAPAFLCFKVTADGTLTQGQTGSATWQLQAASA
jgi:predicted ribosomally synthesized peptide with SipW-like signal peptide